MHVRNVYRPIRLVLKHDFTIEQHAFKKCKQLFEYQLLLLLRDISWSKF